MDNKRELYKRIKELDPKGEIVKIDLSKNTIEYNEEIIKLYREITDLTNEEIVRAYLVLKLIKKLGYSKKHCIELEREYTMGRDPSKGARVDIFLTKEGKPFAMFELKSPEEYEVEMDNAIKNQLFEVAEKADARYHTLKYLIYYTVYISEDERLTEKIVTIDYRKYKTYEEWEDASKPNLMAIPKDYGVVKKPVFIKKGKPDLRTDVTKDELERIRSNIHNILWGVENTTLNYFSI